jgi:S-methylmethionine-dependent homocysteine/selenocysteine methylase
MTMSKYRNALPQLDGHVFLTDGGMETTLLFHDGFELPGFAAFPLLEDPDGRSALRRYYETYGRIAVNAGCGFVLETPTWRANADWGAKIGFGREALAEINRHSARFMHDVRDALEQPQSPFVISGCIGPRGDGYRADTQMRSEEAAGYHREQVAVLAGGDVDLVSAATMTYAEEAVGVVHAAEEVGLPAVISFTTEPDGRLPSGQPLREAIEQVDAETSGRAAYFMLNCAHPSHFEDVLRDPGEWRDRIRGLRANASSLSHEELDQSTELDAGNPEEFGRQYRALREEVPSLTVLGGCCGTDHRHIEQISRHCVQTTE